MDKPFYDPDRKTFNKPRFEATLFAGRPEETRGLLTVKSARDKSREFEIYWHPTGAYLWVANEDISAIVNLKTKRAIVDLAAYYRNAK